MKTTRVTPHPYASARAFTLIEILFVVVIISLILSLTTMGISSVMRGQRLTESGDRLMGIFQRAQQLAFAKGRPVEVLICRMNSTQRYDAALLLNHYLKGEADPADMAQSLQDNLSLVIGDGFEKLATGTCITDVTGMSTIIDNLPSVTPGSSGGGGSSSVTEVKVSTAGGLVPYDLSGVVEMRSFVFYSEGTNLASSAGAKWHVNVVDDSDAQKDAASLRNFYCIQVDPVTSRLSSYRP